VKRRRSQRGFTLIELMVALVISSLLVGMILSIFLRMSLAYRGQQQVANVQSVLAGARQMIEFDAKHAGLGMTKGFRLPATGLNWNAPVRVINNTTAPDEVRFYYADLTTQSYVLSVVAGFIQATVDDPTGFVIGDVVVLSSADISIANPLAPGVDANLSIHETCVLEITNITQPLGVWTIDFSTVAPYGQAPLNNHCPAMVNAMMYKMVGRAYRIDPLRPVDGVLQLSPSGALVANDWQDLAYGFTDLQVATQFFDNDASDSTDPDADPLREWYSGETQETLTDAAANLFPVIQMTISLVSRTDRDVEGIATAATPELRVSTNVNNNTLGDRASETLPHATDLALQGNRIYRYTTFGVDFRNMAVGR
jgi:prepilin-type N-terminal cleavage/methylation domain-containing protein